MPDRRFQFIGWDFRRVALGCPLDGLAAWMHASGKDGLASSGPLFHQCFVRVGWILESFAADQVAYRVQEMRTGLAGAAENGIGWRQNDRGERHRFRAIQIYVDQIFAWFAQQNTDILLLTVEKLRNVFLCDPQICPVIEHRHL